MWVDWLAWGACSATDPCTSGTHERTRTCKDSVSQQAIDTSKCIDAFGDETTEVGNCDAPCQPGNIQMCLEPQT